MELANVCAIDPRQALIRALRKAFQQESKAPEPGRFDIIISNSATYSALCAIANRSADAGKDVIVPIFDSEDSTECLRLAIMRHEGKTTHVHYVEPCVLGAGQEIVLLEKSEERAFHVDVEAGIVQTDLPPLAMRHSGIVKGWVLILLLMKHDGEEVNWPADLAA